MERSMWRDMHKNYLALFSSIVFEMSSTKALIHADKSLNMFNVEPDKIIWDSKYTPEEIEEWNECHEEAGSWKDAELLTGVSMYAMANASLRYKRYLINLLMEEEKVNV